MASVEQPTTVEARLAKTGHVNGLAELRTALKKEGYASSEIQGPALLKQLRDAIRASRDGGQS